MGIGICLVGNFEEEEPTAKQIAAATELVDYLRRRVIGAPSTFTSHKEVSHGGTLCPGLHFPLREMHARFG